MNNSLHRRLVVSTLALLALLAPDGTPLQAQSGPPVTSIEVQYAGPQTLSRGRILSQMRTKVGEPYSQTVVEQDIRTLYASGQVQNVRIFGQQDGAGIKVLVVVQSRSVINEIEIAGAEDVKPSKIRRAMKAVKTGAPLKEDALEEGRQAIIDLYRRIGYNDATVSYELQTDQTKGTTRAVYTIDEGGKGVVSRIHFEGNDNFSDFSLRRKMKTKSKTLISFLDKSGRLDQTQLQTDLDAVREFYQENGYIDVEIKDVRREKRNGKMTLVVVVNEGIQYKVGQVRFTGYKVSDDKRLRAVLKMKEGDTYSPKGLREDGKRLAEGYGMGGYVDLEIVPQSVASAPGQIDVTYNIQEGERAFVDRINIVGNTRTKDKVIRREILITPGDVYNTVRVDVSQKRLENLGYFSKVDMFPAETGVPGRRELTVQVEEKRTGSLNFGAGFSTIDSIVGFVELSQGNFDVMNWPNFTGAGQKFRMRIQAGTERRDFIVSLTEPYFLDQRLSLGGEAFFREATFLSSVYDQRTYGGSLTARKSLSTFTALSTTYSIENLEIYNVSVTATDLIQREKGSRVKSNIASTFIFDTRDNPFLTHRGQRITVTPFIAGGFLGGDTQILGGNIEASQYFSLPFDLIFLINAEVATVDTWGDGDRVPIFDRLFLGGSNNLRGFEFRDVGPKDRKGEPLGGKTLARTTVELTAPVINKIRAAVFYDAGFVNVNALDFNPDDYASDVGIGLRLDLPIGPIRIDYGIPLEAAGNDTSGKFNFNVGYQF